MFLSLLSFYEMQVSIINKSIVFLCILNNTFGPSTDQSMKDWFYKGQAWCSAVVRAVSQSHQVRVENASPHLCVCVWGVGVDSVYPFFETHSCGSLWHWVCPIRLVFKILQSNNNHGRTLRRAFPVPNTKPASVFPIPVAN
jgi:hypothetical protein